MTDQFSGCHVETRIVYRFEILRGDHHGRLLLHTLGIHGEWVHSSANQSSLNWGPLLNGDPAHTVDRRILYKGRKDVRATVCDVKIHSTDRCYHDEWYVVSCSKHSGVIRANLAFRINIRQYISAV